jgi:hypothetical protein
MADIYGHQGAEAFFPTDIPTENFSITGEDKFAGKLFGRQ